jgi:Beta/Gamma crystallin
MKQLYKLLLLDLLALTASSVFADSITFYQGDNFNGGNMSIDRPLANLDGTGFNDKVRSAIVRDGQWELCVDADFGGGCQVFGPGRYSDLGSLSGRVSSARPVAARYQNNGNGPRYGNDVRPGNDAGSRGRSAGATLYESANLSGRSFALSGTMRNLDGTGFNDRAASLHVGSGYWIFCSDAEFRGECRTFGPGDYATLPQGLSNVISSGRMISNDYPYGEQPDWQRANRSSR